MKSARSARKGLPPGTVLLFCALFSLSILSCFLIQGDPVDLYMEVQVDEGVEWNAEWCVQEYYSDEDIAGTGPKAGTALESESGTGSARWKVPLRGNWYYLSAEAGSHELGLRYVAHNLETGEEHVLEELPAVAGGGSLVLYTGYWDLVSGAYIGP